MALYDKELFGKEDVLKDLDKIFIHIILEDCLLYYN